MLRSRFPFLIPLAIWASAAFASIPASDDSYRIVISCLGDNVPAESAPQNELITSKDFVKGLAMTYGSQEVRIVGELKPIPPGIKLGAPQAGERALHRKYLLRIPRPVIRKFIRGLQNYESATHAELPYGLPKDFDDVIRMAEVASRGQCELKRLPDGAQNR